MKILDCTLRDGGYYTNWDFDSCVVDAYIEAMNKLPIDYVEVGYRNNPSKEYLGKFGYSPVSVLKYIREKCNKKLVIMLNEKSSTPDDLDYLLLPIVGLVDMVRIAVDPNNLERAIHFAKSVKSIGFDVGFNIMYMSKWSEMGDFIYQLNKLNEFCDLICMVDSFGGITPEELTKIYTTLRANTSVPIGFHGHNNLQLGLINTITAMHLGVDYVDATILGMGRGAGNLNMELLLTYLNSHNNLKVDFNVLGDVITAFMPLYEKYNWGTNLPYMLAGANKIPQKEVMDWVTNRIYSFNSIVRALENRKQCRTDNAKYPICPFVKKYNRVLIVGGGESVIRHLEGIKSYINNYNDDIVLVFATSRYAKAFSSINCSKFYVLVGGESRRMTTNVCHEHFKDYVILPPYPRTMGTDVPHFASSNTYELSSINFIDNFHDSCTTIAIQTAMNLANDEILTVGYDGYPDSSLSEKERTLSNENQSIFEAYNQLKNSKIKSLTPSLYQELKVVSLYQFI